METGVRKIVYDIKEERKMTGCYGCRYCEDTGYSWICRKTGEKLEGFDSMTDKRNNNKETFLSRNIMVGVGHKCPLCVVKGNRTKVRYDVSLDYIADYVDKETMYVGVDTDDIDENKLRIWISWIEGGYPDDDSHRDWVQNELCEIIRDVEDKYNVTITEGRCDLEYEEAIISFIKVIKNESRKNGKCESNCRHG